VIVEGMKMPHPELMNGGDYVECYLKAAIIGIEVSLVVSGLVLLVGKLRKWVTGGKKKVLKI